MELTKAGKKMINLMLNKFGYQLVKVENSKQFREFVREQFLARAGGILHIGAHFGEERFQYERLNLPVFWIEAVPDFFLQLERNISELQNQKAFQYLLSDQVKEIQFNLANNQGASSSIYKFANKNGFELSGLAMSGTISLISQRLDQIFTREALLNLDHWIIDVQGAELEVLRGAGELLNLCHSIEVEVSRREIYVGGTKYLNLVQFLQESGFIQIWEARDGEHTDVLFVRDPRFRKITN